MVFPVIMYGCKSWTIKKAECRRSALWCWRRLLRVPWTARVNPKGNQSWKCIGRTDAEDKTPFVVHLMWRTDSLEKTLMLGKIEHRRRKGQQRMRWLDGSPTQWWVGSWSWWWTRKPGVLQSVVLQIVGHNWATEPNWTELNKRNSLIAHWWRNR